MQNDNIVVFIHFIWTTWDREPLIETSRENDLYNCLAATSIKHNCRPIAINGMPDHVHALVRLAPTVSLAFMAQQLKGVSANFANHQLAMDATLKWRGSYAAYSVSRWDISRIANYIRKQKQHHNAGTTIADFEKTQPEQSDDWKHMDGWDAAQNVRG